MHTKDKYTIHNLETDKKQEINLKNVELIPCRAYLA